MKKIIRRIGKMSRPARMTVKIGLLISSLYMAAALITLLLPADGFFDTYRNLSIAKELYAAPQALLLVTAVASVIVEERTAD